MSKRQCFYVDATMNPDGQGFIPALVTEDEPGYAPMGRRSWPARCCHPSATATGGRSPHQDQGAYHAKRA